MKTIATQYRLPFEEKPSVLYEYSFVLSPFGDVYQETKAKKRLLHSEIGLSDINVYSKPHISLLKHVCQTESPDLSKMFSYLPVFTEFSVDIDRLHTFDHNVKKSLVLLLREPEPIKQIQKFLLRTVGSRKENLTPHLTIARSIPNEDYFRISDLNRYFFSGGFLCDRVTVLRKPAYSTEKYLVFKEIMLRDAKSALN